MDKQTGEIKRWDFPLTPEGIANVIYEAMRSDDPPTTLHSLRLLMGDFKTQVLKGAGQCDGCGREMIDAFCLRCKEQAVEKEVATIMEINKKETRPLTNLVSLKQVWEPKIPAIQIHCCGRPMPAMVQIHGCKFIKCEQCNKLVLQLRTKD
ncbi:hypothetical protein LCGC14_1796650 [marine sediment metagenome]|uniref:Uncharacterized protein n=1 Tax=marine sediment metagenome TaxID=412755 RepID=A0A0F9GQX5_9ZZZZ